MDNTVGQAEVILSLCTSSRMQRVVKGCFSECKPVMSVAVCLSYFGNITGKWVGWSILPLERGPSVKVPVSVLKWPNSAFGMCCSFVSGSTNWEQNASTKEHHRSYFIELTCHSSSYSVSTVCHWWSPWWFAGTPTCLCLTCTDRTD